MSLHKLKIYRGNGKNYAPIPEIRLKGNWLEDFGFSIGDTIYADCENGQIIIKKPNKSTEEMRNENDGR